MPAREALSSTFIPLLVHGPVSFPAVGRKGAEGIFLSFSYANVLSLPAGRKGTIQVSNPVVQKKEFMDQNGQSVCNTRTVLLFFWK